MTATACPELRSANPASSYMAVQVEMLRRLRHSTVDLYIQYDSTSEPVLYYRAGGPLEADQTSRLLESGVRQVFVRTDEFHRFASHLLDTVDSDAERETVPPSERFAALQLAMAVEIEHAARLVDSGPYVAVADKLGRELTTMLVNNNVLPRDLFRLARHDFLTFTHITNVASYGVLLAEGLGLCDGSQYESLAKAAILHGAKRAKVTRCRSRAKVSRSGSDRGMANASADRTILWPG